MAPLHPEKALMVRKDFAESRAEEHRRLIAALIEACRFCDSPMNRPTIIQTLSQPSYLNVPLAALRPGLTGELDRGDGLIEQRNDFTIFSRFNTNEPSADKAAWILEGLRNSGLCKDPRALTSGLGRRVFCAADFDEALHLSGGSQLEYETQPELEPQPALLEMTRRQFMRKTAGAHLGALFAGLPRAWVGSVYAGDAPETAMLKFGIIALTDCSPIVIASRKGAFQEVRHQLDDRQRRKLGSHPRFVVEWRSPGYSTC